MDFNSQLLLLALGLPLAGGPLLALGGRALGARIGWAALVFPLASTAALGVLAMGVDVGKGLVIEWPWVPSLGLNLSFLVDGLSIFFGLIVSGMGCLVVFYAIHYFGDEDEWEHLGRFYCYLVLFMGAMLGTVFANHLLLLFIFWELTGVASFLLIGFLHEEEGSRVGARQALLVTASTGLALFAGVVLLQQAAGTVKIAELLGAGLPWREHGGILGVAMVLMLVGAFGKSAQFPFHFWLPNAMAAPTPVSAYLHSATMVKLGVFLVARVHPLFAEHSWWAPLLGAIGFATMGMGAVLALLSHDLKAILAFSTVSQLGFLIGYYGLSAKGGVSHDFLHILNHVLYKGCLFMAAGVVSHASGVRDIRQLGGLFRRMPLMGVTVLLGAASMAGLPGVLGFVSKEMALQHAIQAAREQGAMGWCAVICAGVSSALMATVSIRLFANIFLGREREAVRGRFHAPPVRMQLPPFLLALGVLVLGLFPGLLDAPFSGLAVETLHRPMPLSLWHGFTEELIASGVIVGLGLAGFAAGQRCSWGWEGVPRWLRADAAFERGVEGLGKAAKIVTRGVYSDQPAHYLPVIVAFMGALMWGGLMWHRSNVVSALSLERVELDPLRVMAAGFIALSTIGVLLLRRWTAQLISLSVAGFLTCFYFVLYRAPDLALTQILVETVTLILVLLLLARFPRSAQEGAERRERAPTRQVFHVVLSLSAGCLATVLVMVMTANPHEDPIGPLFLAHTVGLAKGSNAVNTILVDFRGFDTLGEIAVLLIATLGCLGLLMRYKRTAEEYRRGPLGPPGFGAEEKGRD